MVRSGLQRRLASRTAPLPWLVLGTGLLLTAVVTLLLQHQERLDRQRRAVQLAEQVGAALDSRISSTIAILSATAGLYQTKPLVSRADFRGFYRALDLSSDTLRGIQGVGFAAVRSRGPADETASSTRPADGPLAPPLTSAIVDLQPDNWRNRRSLGFDMYTEPTRRAAMALAALTGRPSLSGPVRLRQETGSEVQTGTLLYVPVRRAGTDPGSAAAGEGEVSLSSLAGWAYAPLRMGNLLAASLERVDNADLQAARVLLVDGPEPRRGIRLADNRHHDPQPTPADTRWVNRPVVDREWWIGVSLGPQRLALAGLHPTVLLTALSGTLAATAAALAASLLQANHRATLVALEEARKASEERALAAAVFEASPLGMIVTDADGIIQATNVAFAQISGWSQREALGHKANLLRSGRHDEAFYRDLWDAIIQRGYWSGEIWNRHRNGQIRRHELSITAVVNGQHQITQFIGMLQDITDRHLAQEKVRFQALHDPLTGLPNRAQLIAELEHSLAQAQRRGGRVALLFMDLDGFKPVNDGLGHQVGDTLLRAVAQRLRQTVRASDSLCRLGGDEFVLLVSEAGSDDDLRQLGRKLRQAAARPYPELPPSMQLGISVGIACWPEHGRDADDLLHAADLAMYAAKGRQGERLELAPPLLPETMPERV